MGGPKNIKLERFYCITLGAKIKNWSFSCVFYVLHEPDHFVSSKSLHKWYLCAIGSDEGKCRRRGGKQTSINDRAAIKDCFQGPGGVMKQCAFSRDIYSMYLMDNLIIYSPKPISSALYLCDCYKGSIDLDFIPTLYNFFCTY